MPVTLRGTTYMTSNEVARAAGVSPQLLSYHLKRGNIKAPKRQIGANYLWTEAEAQQAIKALEAVRN